MIFQTQPKSQIYMRPPHTSHALSALHKELHFELGKLGMHIQMMPQDPNQDDSFLTKRAAVITDKMAILDKNCLYQNHFGDIHRFLVQDRIIKFIEAPGKIDANDVLRFQDHFFISVTKQTNQEGASQLGYHLLEAGYTVSIIDLSQHGDIKLSSAVTNAGDKALFVRDDLAKYYAFVGFPIVSVPRTEYDQLGFITYEDKAIIGFSCPIIKAALIDLGFKTITIDDSALDQSDLTLSQFILPVLVDGQVLEIKKAPTALQQASA